jgi:hypothetical protein
MKDEKLEFNVANYDTIQCKNCIYSYGGGAMAISCCKFKVKPHGVFYESKECPEFKEKLKIKRDII